MGTQLTDDEVASTVGEEVNAVSGFEGRDVDSVVVFRSLNGDRVEGQAGGIEVSDRKHGVVAGPGVDGDLFNASQLGNHAGVVSAVAGDDDLGAGVELVCIVASDGQVAGAGIDAVGLIPVVAVHHEGVEGAEAAVDHIAAIGEGDPEQARVQGGPVDHVVAGVAVDGVST